MLTLLMTMTLLTMMKGKRMQTNMMAPIGWKFQVECGRLDKGVVKLQGASVVVVLL